MFYDGDGRFSWHTHVSRPTSSEDPSASAGTVFLGDDKPVVIDEAVKQTGRLSAKQRRLDIYLLIVLLHNSELIGLTSHQTHYRSFRGQVLTGQMTQPTVSKH